MTRERFIDEAIVPVVATSETSHLAPGEPLLPREFLWGKKTIEVAAVLRTWRETGPCHHGSHEMYVRKHWYEIATTEGIMKIYFERQPRRGQTHKKERWWLFSIRETA